MATKNVKDYYAVLGVSRNADEKQIKSAYRKLARKHHPDVNANDKTAEAKFKEISEAYGVLGDAERRKLYDQFGSNWEAVQQGGGPSGGNIDFGNVDFGNVDFSNNGFGSLFEQFFGASGGHGATGARPHGVEPTDIESVVEVTLEELNAGASRTLTYQVADACKSCEGTGYVRLRAASACRNCEGTGRVRGMLGMQQACPVCEGTGRSSLEKCPTCAGVGTMRSTKTVTVKIPAGVPGGKKLRVPGQGGLGANGRPGDLYVTIRELPHKQFTRKGDDLETEVTASFATAALGGEVKVPTLGGQLTMTLPESTQSGQTFRLAKKGMTKMGGEKGNLLVRVKVAVPKSLTEKQKEIIRQLAQAEGTDA